QTSEPIVNERCDKKPYFIDGDEAVLIIITVNGPLADARGHPVSVAVVGRYAGAIGELVLGVSLELSCGAVVGQPIQVPGSVVNITAVLAGNRARRHLQLADGIVCVLIVRASSISKRRALICLVVSVNG